MSAYQEEIHLNMVNFSCFYNEIQLQYDHDVGIFNLCLEVLS